MANTNATVLIPDISGFTEFMTNTEKGHGSFVIKHLLDAIINMKQMAHKLKTYSEALEKSFFTVTAGSS
jgi:hypothetical protein